MTDDGQMPDHELFLTDFHAYQWEKDDLEIQFEDFHDSRDGLKALATYLVPSTDGTIDFGTLNLTAPATRKSTAKDLAGKYPRIDADEWGRRLTYIAKTSHTKFKEGATQTQRLIDIEVDYTAPPMLIDPLVPKTGVVTFYGDGTAGKSTIVAALLLSIATGIPTLGLTPAETGPVIYFDWEDGGETLRERMDALCATLEIKFPENFHYREMDRPASASEARIRREVEALGAKAAAFDSIGMMLGGDPKEAELIIPATNVMKRTGIACLGVHHLSAAQAESTDMRTKQRPYGSIYARNAARMQWLVERFQEPDADEAFVYLFNTKVNRGKRKPPRAYRAVYRNDSEVVSGVEVEHLRGLKFDKHDPDDYYSRNIAATPASSMKLPDRCLATLERMDGWYTAKGLWERILADGFTCEEQSVRNALNALVKKGLVTDKGERAERRFIASSVYSTRTEGF